MTKYSNINDGEFLKITKGDSIILVQTLTMYVAAFVEHLDKILSKNKIDFFYYKGSAEFDSISIMYWVEDDEYNRIHRLYDEDEMRFEQKEFNNSIEDLFDIFIEDKWEGLFTYIDDETNLNLKLSLK